MGGRCATHGRAVSFDNYAVSFFRNGWATDIWTDDRTDDPARGSVKKPPTVPAPNSSKDKNKK